MHQKISKLQWLKDRLDECSGDDFSRPWSDYPCVEWPFGKAKGGYGLVHQIDTMVYVHRESFLMSQGEIIDGNQVCHHCDNRPCFRPVHLFQGDRIDNMHDCVKKGRQQHGERHYRAQITNEVASRAVEMRRSGMTPMQISVALGITRQNASRISLGNRWRAASGISLSTAVTNTGICPTEDVPDPS